MACPVCFGDSNEPMAIATNYGIWFMLGIVALVLSAFASFFIYLIRRARLAGDQNPPGSAIRGEEAHGLDGAGGAYRRQEGTA